ncbi:MAG: hypothetical protein ACXW1T_06085, partial [Methylophilus sp.]
IDNSVDEAMGGHAKNITVILYEDESLEVFELSFRDCMEMIYQGQITDGKTIVAMMFAEHYLKHHG